MRSQELQQVSDVVPSSSSWGEGSNRIAALNLEGTPPPKVTDSPDHKQFDHHDEHSKVFPIQPSSLSFLAMHFLSLNFFVVYVWIDYLVRIIIWVYMIDVLETWLEKVLIPCRPWIPCLLSLSWPRQLWVSFCLSICLYVFLCMCVCLTK